MNVGLTDRDRLLVTGAAGHSGLHLMRGLAARGHGGRVVAVVRGEAGLAELRALPLDLEILRGDLDDAALRRRAARGADVVLHAATLYASERIVAAADAARRVVLVHTTGRYSRFKSARADYERIEDGLLARHDHLTILRPTMIYGGPRAPAMTWLIRQVARRRVMPVVGIGRNLMQPVLARDLGAAYLSVLTREAATTGRCYDLPGRDAAPYGAMLRTIAAILGRRVALLPVPLGLARAGLGALRRVRPGFPIVDEQVLRLAEDKAFDWSEAARDFGYAPTDLATGLAEHVAALGLGGRTPREGAGLRP